MRTLWLLAGAFIALDACAAAAQAGSPARIVVADETVNSPLLPFTFTVGGLGEGAGLSAGGAFEPIIHRTRLIARADARDRIEAEPDAVSNHDTLRSGALDGADVDIYRIEGGVLRHVGRRRVAEGGHHVDDWRLLVPEDRMIPPGAQSFVFSYESWRRPGAPLWFAVRAVAADGTLSARAVTTLRGPGTPRGPKADNPLAPRPRAQEGGAAPPAPQGLAARMSQEGAVVLDWRADPSGRAVGHVVEIAHAPPERLRTPGFDLAPDPTGPGVRAGDLLILGRKLLTPRRDQLVSDRIWNAGETSAFRQPLVSFWPGEDPARDWRLAPHASDTPVEEPGETYLELRAAGRGEIGVGRHLYAGRAQTYYPVLEPAPYRISVWLRADRPARAILRFTGPYETRIRPKILDVGTRWRRHVVEVTPPSTLEGERVGGVGLFFQGPGVFHVDNLRIHRADTAFLDLSDADRARVADSGMGALRTHGFVKTHRRTYDLAQLTNPGGVASGTIGGVTLPQTLGVAARAGLDLWLQVEPHLSPDEWRGLIEYLAAPSDPARPDLPWAAKRRAQGRAAPWTDAFDRIYLEVGNETWNRLFRPWTFEPMSDAADGRIHPAGRVYGLFVEHVAATLRASPHWRAAGLDAKVRFVLGGQRSNPAFGLDAAAAAPGAHILTMAAYNGGWDEGEGPPARTPASYFNVLNQVSQSAIPSADAMAEAARRLSAGRPAPLALGTYEAGPGYALNGLNGAKVSPEQAVAQEEVMRSQAAGVATLDTFLALAARSFSIQNYFIFGAGRLWASHTPWHRGGAPSPAWELLSAFNREGLGDMLRVDVLGGPVADLAEGPRRAAVADAPLIAAYATRRGDRMTLVVLSRRVPGHPEGGDGFTPATVELPIVAADRVVLRRMAGPHDAHNFAGQAAVIETVVIDRPPALTGRVPLDARLGATDRGLPPGSAFIWTFEGVR